MNAELGFTRERHDGEEGTIERIVRHVGCLQDQSPLQQYKCTTLIYIELSLLFCNIASTRPFNYMAETNIITYIKVNFTIIFITANIIHTSLHCSLPLQVNILKCFKM